MPMKGSVKKTGWLDVDMSCPYPSLDLGKRMGANSWEELASILLF